MKRTQPPSNREGFTRRFYERFKSEYVAFLHSIQGSSSEAERARYASLLLSRLMFAYFLQKKGWNSDLFDVHELERANPCIHIPDEALARLFAFFDSFVWQLDERSPRHRNEINPGMLGYIFEKHINQKEIGAYYTREDITAYIAKSTIIPFIFDAVERTCSAPFRPDGPIWQLLCANPDRYIYPAMKKGVVYPLPPEIAAGLASVSQRTLWNNRAPEAFALPTETWREVVARHKHYEEVQAKLVSGQVHCINELVTYNLDIHLFTLDVIEQCQESACLQAFYESLEQITVLDPTCGPGAFLFAALDILAPLFAACLDRMQAIVNDYDQHTQAGDRQLHESSISNLRDILKQVEQSPGRRYFILRSIITNNLYGVDIMEEAIELCKMRLFLKLAAQVERAEDLQTLPSIHFNIHAGNTLAGSFDETGTQETIEQNSHPFHWFSEFHHIVKRGGFDVIIGNPPYVEFEKARETYMAHEYSTLPTRNLYALTIERCHSLLANGGRFGMIVPSSATCTDGYLPLQKILLGQSALHISSYSDQRGRLFDIPHPRLCIILYQKCSHPKGIFSTPYLKLGRELRDSLFQRLEYTEVTGLLKPGVIPRYGSSIERTVHAKLHSQPHCLGEHLSKTGNHKVYYTRKLSWYVQVTPFIPAIVDEQGRMRHPSELKTLLFPSPEYADIAFVALNSNLFYWFVTTGSDCRNLNMREVLGLPLAIDTIPGAIRQDLRKLAADLAGDLQAHSEYRKMHFKGMGTLTIQCIFPGKSQPIIDEIDRVLARHYGFIEEELDFIVNYDSKYRLGRNSKQGDDDK